MKHLLNNLSEEEKNSIREQHTGEIKVVTENFSKLINAKSGSIEPIVAEQTAGAGPWYGGYGPGPSRTKTYDVTRPVKMDGSIFANGVDTIDTNSEQFKKGVDAIKDALQTTKNLTVTVQGGASAVGGKNFDNKALAKRRATNFIRAIKSYFPNVNFVEGDHVVGNATVKDSDAAKAEQFVKLMMDRTSVERADYPAIDHTAVQMKVRDLEKVVKKKPIKNEQLVTKCIRIPESWIPAFVTFIKELGIKEA